MTIQYITPGLTSMIRNAVGPFFMHTYTRSKLVPTPDNPATTTVDESQDVWGEPVSTSAVDVPGLPCLYQEVSQTIIQPNGPVGINVPVLAVPNTDTLSDGDHVKNIATKPDPVHGVPSVVLVAGPVRVEGVAVVGAEFGGAIYKVAQLREVSEVLG